MYDLVASLMLDVRYWKPGDDSGRCLQLRSLASSIEVVVRLFRCVSGEKRWTSHPGAMVLW
jgi:hypothetical protein